MTEPAGIQTYNSWESGGTTRRYPQWQSSQFPSASLLSLLTQGSGALSQARTSNPYPTASLASVGRESSQGQARAPTRGCPRRGVLPGAALLAFGLEKSREGSTALGHPRQPNSASPDVQPSSGFSACPRKKRRRKRKGITQQHPHLEETGDLHPRRKDKRRLDKTTLP